VGSDLFVDYPSPISTNIVRKTPYRSGVTTPLSRAFLKPWWAKGTDPRPCTGACYSMARYPQSDLDRCHCAQVTPGKRGARVERGGSSLGRFAADHSREGPRMTNGVCLGFADATVHRGLGNLPGVNVGPTCSRALNTSRSEGTSLRDRFRLGRAFFVTARLANLKKVV